MLWLIGAFAAIGVRFNMKMMEAYMVLPAFYLFALMAWKGKWFKENQPAGRSDRYYAGCFLVLGGDS